VDCLGQWFPTGLNDCYTALLWVARLVEELTDYVATTCRYYCPRRLKTDPVSPPEY
jgi:hypothetical protein